MWYDLDHALRTFSGPRRSRHHEVGQLRVDGATEFNGTFPSHQMTSHKPCPVPWHIPNNSPISRPEDDASLRFGTICNYFCRFFSSVTSVLSTQLFVFIASAQLLSLSLRHKVTKSGLFSCFPNNFMQIVTTLPKPAIQTKHSLRKDFQQLTGKVQM